MFGGVLLETDEELRARLYYLCLPGGKFDPKSSIAIEIAQATDEELDALAWRINIRRRRITII